MRLTTLGAITLALSVCGNALAQVGTLVERDTANDACKQFKMRVLMPADVSTKPRSESPVGAPDPGIVWNPCGGEVVQFAVIPFRSKPGRATLSAAPSFRLLPTPPRSVQPRSFVAKVGEADG